MEMWNGGRMDEMIEVVDVGMWENGWEDRWMDEWKTEWMRKWTDGQIGGQIRYMDG